MKWSRRQFLTIAGVGLGAGAGFVYRRSRSTCGPAADCLLRPPGALNEDDFLAACIRCGQCVEACPVDALEFDTSLEAGRDRGSPYVNARNIPCNLCEGHDDLKCIAACPTGALSPVADIRDIRMGTAVIDEDRCLAYNGTVCRACWHVCPLPNEAIRFDAMLRVVVVEDACIGCGLCDHACLTTPSSIPIRPAAASGTVKSAATREGAGE